MALRIVSSYLSSMQDAVLAASPCVTGLRDLSLHSGHPDESADDLSCIAALTGLQTLSLDGIPNLFCMRRNAEGRGAPLLLPVGLTALRLVGCVAAGAGERLANPLGSQLLTLPGLQHLEIEVAVEAPAPGMPGEVTRTEVRVAPGPGGGCVHVEERGDAAVAAVRRAVWDDLRPALMHLPLRLGARIDVHAAVAS